MKASRSKLSWVFTCPQIVINIALKEKVVMLINMLLNSICSLWRLALYWFHAPGLKLDSEVSQSTDQPHGTVCHQHYSHRTCRRAPSSGHRRRTCSRPPGTIGILALDINIPSHLLAYWDCASKFTRWQHPAMGCGTSFAGDGDPCV